MIAEPVAPQTVPMDTEPGAKPPASPATNGKRPTDAAALAAVATNGAP